MSDFFKLNKNFIGDMNVDQIRRLREVFAANATIYLEVCFVGQDKELIQELARITGAKVYASNDKQGPDDGMDWDFEVCYYVNDKGQVKTCSPEGGGGVW